MDRIPHFLYSDTNCEGNCEYVYGVILAFPHEDLAVRSLGQAIKQAWEDTVTEHGMNWEVWKNFSDKPYKDFLEKYPQPDIQKIISERCLEFGYPYYPKKGGIKI